MFPIVRGAGPSIQHIATAAVAIAIAAFFLITPVILPAVNYNKAESLRAEGQYEEAIVAFEALDGYKDSETQIAETRYQQGKALT